MIIFRTFGTLTALALAAYAAADLAAAFARPGYSASDVFLNQPTPKEKMTSSIRGMESISFDGELLADYAAVRAAEVLRRPVGDAKDGTERSEAAERALIRALQVSPIRPTLWLALGTLRARAGKPVAPALKMSYLTGPLPTEIALLRIRTATSTSAADDEEIRYLAGSDVRSILADRYRFEGPLTAIYAQSTPAGRSLLLDASQAVDPQFGATLRRQ
jgi:hypothetical protein